MPVAVLGSPIGGEEEGEHDVGGRELEVAIREGDVELAEVGSPRGGEEEEHGVLICGREVICGWAVGVGGAGRGEVEALSAEVAGLSGVVQAVSGEVETLGGEVETLSSEVEGLSTGSRRKPLPYAWRKRLSLRLREQLGLHARTGATDSVTIKAMKAAR